MTQCYSPLYCAKHEFTNSIPSLLGPFVGGVCRNAALLCFIYDKICLFNFAVVKIWNCDSFFLVDSGKSSGSLTPSTLADVFRCYVLCGLSELNILFLGLRGFSGTHDFLAFFQSDFLFRPEKSGVNTFCFIQDATELTWLTSQQLETAHESVVLSWINYVLTLYYLFFKCISSFQALISLTTHVKD